MGYYDAQEVNGADQAYKQRYNDRLKGVGQVGPAQPRVRP